MASERERRPQGPLRAAVLGPGGVGGLIAGALARAAVDTVVVAREPTVALISVHGLQVSSVRLGEFVARPRAVAYLRQPVDVLIVATKADRLAAALERICCSPGLVLPLLNGLDHIATLRDRFGQECVVAGSIRVEADRPRPGVVVHTSPFLRVDMASRFPGARPRMEAVAAALGQAGIPSRVLGPSCASAEAQLLWSKLVRLNALACTTSAFDRPIGEIRSTPELRADLIGAIEEGAAVARAEGADIDPRSTLGELTEAHASLGSSMQRDIAAGRPPELDAIAGAVLRAAERNAISCPTVQRLAAMVAARAGVRAPGAQPA